MGCVLTNSSIAALHMCSTLGIVPDDEVVLPSFTLTIGSKGGLFVTDDEFYYKRAGLPQYFVSVN